MDKSLLLKGSCKCSEVSGPDFSLHCQNTAFTEAAEGVISTKQASAVYKTHIPPRGARNTVILPEESPELPKSWD